jgi:uncharacterized pyridoxamine 5'-phosphate oxidase family protein
MNNPLPAPAAPTSPAAAMAAFLAAFLAAILAAVLALPAAPAYAQQGDQAAADAATVKVFEFVKGCGHYFLATADGDQPRVRPFGSLAIFEGRIYFQTGKVKSVSKQIMANPKIEIAAFDGRGSWIRVQAVAVEDDRLEAKQFMLDQMPELKSMYSADDGNTQVFYLKDATATLSSFGGEGWTERF